MGVNVSNEYEQTIRLLYQTILGREADEAGLLHYTRELQTGKSLLSILEEFENCAEYKLRAKLFVPAGHFYSPVVSPSEAKDYLSSIALKPKIDQIPGIMINQSQIASEFISFIHSLKDIPFSAEEKPELRYKFNNGSYSWGDASILYAMLRKYKPRRFIEIGSGWSSACSLDTIEKYFPGECEITFIEPYPDLLKRLIGKTSQRITMYEIPVQQVDLSVFSELDDGDFLFIDSTHVAKTGSDVCYEIFEILPSLKKGVRVHFHDIFWPFEYPYKWTVEENRSWNEIYLLRAFLYENTSWKVTFFNDFIAVHDRELIASHYPNFLLNSGGAIWLQKLA